jgi:LacI family transcriptional regulator
MVTRDDVARTAGVSPSTVSYVINEGPRTISQRTRQKVLEVIRELGYHPNAVARNLRRQRTSSLGLIIPDIINPYFAQIAQGIEAAAFEQDYMVVFCHSNYSIEQEIKYIDHLFKERTAGVIWVPATSDPTPANRLKGYGIPAVVVDRVVDGANLPAVLSENEHGGFLATEHLIQNGHKRIGCIARPVRLSHSQGRILGYRNALRKYKIPFDEQLIAPGGYRLENGYQAIQYLLKLVPQPTAVFTYNDTMAFGAIRALHDAGYRIPEDFSVVGFDDIPEAGYHCPSLTTIRQEKYGMGTRSVELLQKIMSGEDLPDDHQVCLDVELVLRESSGPLNQGKNIS